MGDNTQGALDDLEKLSELRCSCGDMQELCEVNCEYCNAYEKISSFIETQKAHGECCGQCPPLKRDAVDVEELKKEVCEEIRDLIYDTCHSCSQPSMQGKTWGEIRDYITEHTTKAVISKINHRFLEEALNKGENHD